MALTSNDKNNHNSNILIPQIEMAALGDGMSEEELRPLKSTEELLHEELNEGNLRKRILRRISLPAATTEPGTVQCADHNIYYWIFRLLSQAD